MRSLVNMSTLQPGTPVDRYTLRVLISTAGRTGIQLWQAYDPVLDRPVGIRMIPAGHPRASATAEAARRAATVEERHLVAVLDVLDDVIVTDDEGDMAYVAIVHEWSTGRTLADLLEEREGEALPVADAVHLTRQVATAIAHAHRAGVTHGRIRPGCLLITGSTDPAQEGEVRVRGLGVDHALWGPSPDPEVDRPDVHGIGSLLYAFITARWPEGLSDGVSGAPRQADRLLEPTAVVAEVPMEIDEICIRSIDARVWATMPAPRGGGREEDAAPYADVDALLAALAAAADAPASTRRRSLTSLPTLPALPTRPAGSTPTAGGRRVVRRVGAGVLAAAAVAALGLVGLRISAGAPSPWATDASPVAAGVLTDTGDDAGSGRLTDFQSGVIPGQIVATGAVTLDPEGSDGVENPEDAALAIDRNPLTAWTTETYYSANLGGKSGVGLVMDLGTAEAVSAVRLDLVGVGSSLSIRVGSNLDVDPEEWVVLAQADTIGESIDLRSPRPVIGRYVMVWFTSIPPAESGFVGGVREVAVLP